MTPRLSVLLAMLVSTQDPVTEPAFDAAAHGMNPEAFDRLVGRAIETNSDALLLWKDGETIFESYFDEPIEPIEAMSATKSVVGIAFLRLLADGRLQSLDEPVHTFYPEWNQGQKARITIRHLLTQRSGLQCEPITTEIYRSPDFVQLALAAELSEEPGTAFRYNNKACNLLAGLVQKIAGKRMDVLLGEEVFEPLGIFEWSWSLDSAGNPHGMSGLQILPADLVKLGQLMLDEGRWENRQLLRAADVAEAVRDYVQPPVDPQAGTLLEFAEQNGGLYRSHYGLLWWVQTRRELGITDRLLAEWRRTNAPEEFLARMSPLTGLPNEELYARSVELAGGEQAWSEATWMAQRPDFDVLAVHFQGFLAQGFLGQYLLVLPEHRLIAARMRRAPEGDYDSNQVDSLRDFSGRVLALVGEDG